MFKALLKKQMMEVNTWLIQDKKRGKTRSKKGMLTLILLYVVLFGFIGGIFFAMAKSLCAPLVALNLGWLYFAIMSLISVVMGVFGSVFNTFTTLYQAKDNELLLSMPIKPSYILTARILGVYLWSFIYTALVFIPTIIVFMVYGAFSVPALISGILMLIVLSVFVLMLSCILGWVVAKISVKIKHKSFITVIASLAFIAIYYFFYFKAMEILSELLANALTIGTTIKGKALPIYWLGNAATGNFLFLLIVALIVAILMAITLYVMSRSFLKMATTNKGEKRKAYKKQKSSLKSVDEALLGKELRRYTSSANYMINCSLGTLFLPILGVAALIKMDWVRGFISSMGMPDNMILLIVCLALCSMATFNDITSPSVSLEGKNLWLVQSLPISPWTALKAKIKLHLWLTEIPVLFCSICICIAAGFNLVNTVLCLFLPALFALSMAAFGLFLNLKFPNLTWTNEIIPIKQSASVTIALFGGWGLVGIFVGLFYLFGNYMEETLFLVICAAVLIGISTGLIFWLKNKGAKIFSSL